MDSNQKIKKEMEKWARFLYELWQKEKVKKTKDNEIDE